jgi:predicted short-subunit dehydrogenase-like oxidoreductase (DUF2520 family)
LRSDKVGIAGAGRVAQALGRALYQRGVDVAYVASRHRNRAESAAEFIGPATTAVEYSELPSRSGRLLIAVSDSAIESVARVLADGGARDGIALHTCGAKGTEALRALSDCGVACGTLHPLQTVREGQGSASALTGISFAVSGDGKAVAWAEEIARLLEGHVLRIRPECQVLYHTAAVMASNYITTLMDVAQELLVSAGLDPADAVLALAPLVRTSVENAVTLGTTAALTGPIARGDSDTVASHLNALSNRDQRVSHLYSVAGLNALAIAERRGLDQAKVAAVANVLKKN